MSRETALARGRQMAEAGMSDSCVIRRRTSQGTDDLTGDVTPTYVVVYTGACRVQQSIAEGQRVDSGQVAVVVLRRELQLPVVASAGVLRGDEATMTVCVNDPALPGRTFVLRDQHSKSEATARRMICEEPT